MAVVVEVSNSASATGATSVTVPAITPAGSNRHVIGFGGNSAGSLANYTDMTWGGAAMTPKANTTNPSYLRTVAEELNAPAASSASLVYTVASSQDELAACAVCLSGVDATTPTGTYATGGTDTGDPMTITVTLDAGDLGIAWFYTVSGTIATGDTSLQEIENINGSISVQATSKAGASASMTGTRGSIGLNDWSGIAVNVNVSSGGGGGDPAATGFKSLLGVGVK